MPPADPATTDSAGSNGIGILDDATCRDVLTRQRLCVLATADGDQPYAVPIFYGFDGTTIYLGIAEGRKTAVLDRNPKVCITVSEVGPGDRWRSVLVMGRAEWITEPSDRERAIQVMMEHNRRPERQVAQPARSAAAPRRHQRGRMLRIADAEISGRTRL
jgi:nitroimidazol reductase NimA-like FMN-containing flavoprotein (pyridoxamine 5'-phosphate oxidase superfamily)